MKILLVIGVLLSVSVFSTNAHAQGICDRTPQVIDGIIWETDKETCEEVTDVDLAEVEELDLSEMGITSLKAHDFKGLVNLYYLNVRTNNLETLPEGLLDDNVNLWEVYFGKNQLKSLPDKLLHNAPDLEAVGFNHNQLTGLPADLFDGQTDWLWDVYLNDNQIEVLPKWNLSHLTDLEWFNLRRNKLQNISPESFSIENFPEYSEVGMFGNPLTDADLALLEEQLGERLIMNEKNKSKNKKTRPLHVRRKAIDAPRP